MRFIAAFCAMAVATLGADAPDPRAIVERSVSKDQLNWNRAQDYTMIEHKITRELDGGRSSPSNRLRGI